MYGVSNLDNEIYFNGGGPKVIGDPSSGEVGPDSIMWICSQTKLITSVSSSPHHIPVSPELLIETCQLAALKLIEQGKITFDTPISDYLPQFCNPIIVDRIDTQETVFRPAETVVTIRHLLTMTSGLFYPAEPASGSLPEGYSSKKMHYSEDPISELFRIITVRSFFLGQFIA